MKVLIVDDAAANRLVLSTLLSRLGHEVRAVASAEEALNAVSGRMPEAVLTDLHMPGGQDGLSLARELKTLAKGAPLRVALMTGDPANDLDLSGDVDTVLEKPVLLKDLEKFLREDQT